MFGLTLACAFAASTPTVVAKMPTLAIAIRARFMIYLPFEISSAEGNACVKANVPKRLPGNRRHCCEGEFSAGSSDDDPPRVWESKGRDRSGGVSGTLITGGSASGTHYARQRFLTERPARKLLLTGHHT